MDTHLVSRFLVACLAAVQLVLQPAAVHAGCEVASLVGDGCCCCHEDDGDAAPEGCAERHACCGPRDDEPEPDQPDEPTRTSCRCSVAPDPLPATEPEAAVGAEPATACPHRFLLPDGLATGEPDSPPRRGVRARAPGDRTPVRLLARVDRL